MKNLMKCFAISIILLFVSCSKDDGPSDSDKDPQIDLKVTTKSITDLTAFSAISGGEVSGGASISERGICWDTNDTPTVQDSDYVSDIETIKGAFSSKMTMLEPSSKYYVRAYAKTTSGDIVYGKSESFTTEAAVQNSESNSYLVKPNQLVVIPVSRANKSMLGNQISADDVLNAELVWMDNLDVIDAVFVSGVGDMGSVVVTTGDSNGNAVVAVRVDGEIVWSWHIWVIEDAESIGSITMPSGAKLMDRNLGATSRVLGEVETIGLQYQFGRKDPFVGTASFGTPVDRDLYDIDGNILEINLVDGPENLAFATANPIMFITTPEVGQDWCEEDIRDWWDTEDGSKSVYDPSPEGWKVAKLEDYTDLVDDNFDMNVEGGQLFIYDGQSNYWPYTGYRENHGGMDATGNFGALWTSQTITGDPGFHSSFCPTYGMGGTASINGSPKVRAMSLRCVKE